MAYTYVYCWHELDYPAIKVGRGEDPRFRMRRYADSYGLNPDPDSVRKIWVHEFVAPMVEAQGRWFLRYDCDLYGLRGPREVFPLRGKPYNGIAELVIAACQTERDRLTQGHREYIAKRYPEDSIELVMTLDEYRKCA